MPVVGEAIITVRVVSDRLAADIRDAVKRGMAQAAPDIDKEGEDAGRRMTDGINRGVRKNRESAGKELEVYVRRFVSGADGVFDDGGRRLGQRFSDSISDGIRRDEDRRRTEIERSVSKSLALRSGSEVEKLGHDLGTRFTHSIGQGVGDSDIGKELAIRDTGLERQGHDMGSRFGRSIGSGIRDEQERIWVDARKAFRMRPGDIDDDGRFSAFTFANGAEDGFKSRFRRFVDFGRRMAGNVGDGLQKGFIRSRLIAEDAGQRVSDGFHKGFIRVTNDANDVGDRLGNSFTRGFRKARVEGDRLFNGLRLGFNILRHDSNTVGDDIGNGIGDGTRRGVNRNRNGLLSDFGKIGKELGSAFNLGIGAAKMGSAIISILATAGPSLIAGAAAIGAAMAAEIIVAMAAIGPGLAGAVGVGLAAVSTLALNFGLLYLAVSKAFKTIEGAEIKKSLKEIGNLLGTPVAQGLLEGMRGSVDRLKAAVPQLTESLKENGKAWGGVITKILDTVSSGENMGRLKGILATNATFVTNFGDGLKGLTDSFLILFNASKPFIDFIGEGIKRFGEWAGASLAVSEANGNLGRWMDGMLQNFKDLWAIVKDFGKGIGNIFSAAAPAGKTLLESIGGIAEKFRAWTSDTGNMERMTAFFDKAHTLASRVFEILGAIFTAGGKAFEGMDLGPIMHVLDTMEHTVVPAIARIFNQIQAGASENLVKAFDNIGTALTKIADSGTFQKVAAFMSSIFEKVTELAASDFGSTILSWVLPIALLGGALLGLLGPVFNLVKGLAALLPVLTGISAPVLGVVAAVAAVAAAFVVMYNNSESLRTAVGDLVSAVSGTLTEIWDKLAPKVQMVWEKFQALAGVIGDRLAPIIEFLIPILQRVLNFFGDTFANIFDLISGFIDLLIGLFTGNWEQVWNGFVEIVKAVVDQILNVLGFLKDMASFIWDAITATIYNAGQYILGFLTALWNTIWGVIQPIWNTIYAFFETIWNNITTAIRNFGNAIPPFLSGLWDTIRNAVVTAWNAIVNFFNTIGSNIADAIRGMGNAIQRIWNDILATAGRIWNNIFDTVSGWIRDIAAAPGRAWNALVGIVSAIWSAISSAITGPIEAAWRAVTGWIQRIVDAVQGVIRTVTSAFTTVNSKMADILARQGEANAAAAATLGGPAVGILDPMIPNFASGGIIFPSPGGSIIRVAEAGRPERVDPIQRNGLTARDEALIRMLTASLTGTGGGNDVNVNVQLGERSLEAFVTSVIKRNDDRQARRVGRVRPT